MGTVEAEIVGFVQLTEAGSMAVAKGWVPIEGEEHVMADGDGDVVGLRSNV